MGNQGAKILTHASAFFMPFLVPIAMFIVSKMSMHDELVERTAIQAVLFQLVMGVLISISAFFSVFLIGIPFLIGFSIMWVVVPILGIIQTLNGGHYEYPIVRSFM
ncbi:MAG TPA: DUF4870 domain-containing protein [Savagea sp.]